MAAVWSQGKETPEDLGGIQAGLALQSHQLQFLGNRLSVRSS